MSSGYVDAFMLGYLKAALKEHLAADIVDSLFKEAEDAARDAANVKVGGDAHVS